MQLDPESSGTEQALFGSYVIQVYGPEAHECKDLIKEITDLIAKGEGEHKCTLVIYSHDRKENKHKWLQMTVNEALEHVKGLDKQNG